MRDVKYIAGLLILAASVLLTWACYLQSPGAGVSMGILLAIVIIAFFYDHRRHIFHNEAPADRPGRSMPMQMAMRTGRLTAMRQDGDISAH
tara:strand:+ start:5314 stop:5586 length:273 start_codon:yes stop_codon:yes gene_type:complete